MRKSTLITDLKSLDVFPWDKLLMSPEQELLMYRDWGFFFAQNLKPEISERYYTKALQLEPEDVNVLQYRSKCRRSIAHIRPALEDSLKAAAIDPNNAGTNLEVCDALYELNRFEDNLAEVHNNTHKFTGRKVDKFLDRLVVVEENLKDSLGESLGPFMFQNEHAFDKIHNEFKRSQHVDKRPLWKILRDDDQCDVLSVMEKEEELLSPLEIARRKRMFAIFNQLYYNKAWIDVLFLKHLRKNSNLLLSQSKESTPKLRELVNDKYEIIKRFLKMLQARSPWYHVQYNRCRNKRMCEKNKQATLFRIQYQTRRNMLAILREIRILRAMKKIEELASFTEEAMGDYVVIKTHRVMPWKIEFLNEVYNTLALAYAESYAITDAAFDPTNGPQLSVLLRYEMTDTKEFGKFVFGDRSTFTEADAPDYGLIVYKKTLARFEKRLHFAKYPIERSYIFHAISLAHFNNSHHEECCLAARKAMEEAKKCNSHIWKYLAQLSIIRARSIVGKIEACQLGLNNALSLVRSLKNPEVYAFVKLCSNVNEQKMEKRKQTRPSEVMMRKSKTAVSMRFGSNETRNGDADADS